MTKPGAPFLLAAFLCVPAAAQVETLSLRTRKWDNPACASAGACDLKEVRFAVKNYKVLIDGSYSYGTGLSAHYRTRSVGNLEKYGFVQWIRGCQFESEALEGEVEVRWTISREYREGTAPYRHPRWVIDTVDLDPFYNSATGLSRHHLYQWNRVPGSVQRATRVFYGQAKPPKPELYVLDHPGTAFFVYGRASNISLEFRTCLYRASDVPVSGVPESAALPGALTCFDWSSSYVYDHAAGRYESRKDLHPACLSEDEPRLSALPAVPVPAPPLLRSAAPGLLDFDGALIR